MEFDERVKRFLALFGVEYSPRNFKVTINKNL